MTDSRRAWLAIAVFIIWAAITAGLPHLWSGPRSPTPIADVVTGAVQPVYIIAVVFLFLSVGFFGWRDMGLNVPRPWSSLRLLWLPALYLALFALVAIAVGLPPVGVVAVVAANTLMVGISEELACRGILFGGLLPRFGLRTAILVTTALFGLVHLTNGFTTGDFGAAAMQAIAACMSGLAFLAIRIRTGSLYPGIVVHALWDWALVTASTASVGSGQASGNSAVQMIVFPLLLNLPVFLYGLFLLRRAFRAGGTESLHP